MEIVLAGSSRTVTSVAWQLSGQHSGVDAADIDFRVYANDGAEGEPGTLLWQRVVTELVVAPGIELYEFSIPRVSVPDRITVTSRILDSSPIATGRVSSMGTSVGTYVARWVDSSGFVRHSRPLIYGVRINAVPEPCGAIVMGIATILLFGWNWRHSEGGM